MADKQSTVKEKNIRIFSKIDGTTNNTFDRAYWQTPPFDLFYGPDIEIVVDGPVTGSGPVDVDPLFDPMPSVAPLCDPGAAVDPLFDPTPDISD